MKTKRKNPYQMLMDDAKKFARSVKYRVTKSMWFYPKEKLGGGWNLDDLWERTAAAEQLGYDVVLAADKDGLRVNYVKKPPDAPFGCDV